MGLERRNGADGGVQFIPVIAIGDKIDVSLIPVDVRELATPEGKAALLTLPRYLQYQMEDGKPIALEDRPSWEALQLKLMKLALSLKFSGNPWLENVRRLLALLDQILAQKTASVPAPKNGAVAAAAVPNTRMATAWQVASMLMRF